MLCGMPPPRFLITVTGYRLLITDYRPPPSVFRFRPPPSDFGLRISDLLHISPCIGGQNLSFEPLPPCLQQVTRRARRFFLGANRAVVSNPTDEANRCILRHVRPKTLQKALYVGSFEIGQLSKSVNHNR